MSELELKRSFLDAELNQINAMVEDLQMEVGLKHLVVSRLKLRLEQCTFLSKFNH